MSNIKFSPARGVEEKLLAHEYTEGMMYFATDSGRIFLDSNGENKIPLGGGGVSIIYGDDKEVIEDKVEQTYTFHINALSEGSNPKVSDLIINSDGRFYKIQEVLIDSGLLICTLIAVSGTGGGGGGTGGGGTSDSKIEIVPIETLPSMLIYGEPYNVTYKVTSQVDDYITVYCQIINETTKEEKPVLQIPGNSGEPCTFDIGSYLFKGSNLVIIWADDNNGNVTGELRQVRRNAIEMVLNEGPSFNPLKVAVDEALRFYCVPVGDGLEKTLEVSIKNPESGVIEWSQKITTRDSRKEIDFDIPKRAHGYYILEAVLSYGSVSAKPLVYEVVWAERGNKEPIIWLDTYPTEIADHDKLIIQYRVYNPEDLPRAETHLYVNQLELPTSPVTVSYSNDGPWTWEKWQITNYTLGTNEFLIQSGKTKRPFSIKVIEDTTRDLNILSTGLHLNLDSKGRSNRENQSTRNKWEYTNINEETTSVIFNNFNWYNNGWILDEEDNSCLRISNGASIQVPLKVLTKNGLSSSLTFEFQFKLRNVQNYATLITTTSYEDEKTGEVIVNKTANTEEGVFGRYFNNNIGLCLGTQEAFFKTGFGKIVNGRYKEEEIINLSFVIEQKSQSINKPLIYIYINGIMSGIASYSDDDFKADLEYFEFNSTYCDVDLYKMRVYKKAFSSSEIVHNYIADYADADLYDMNEILDNNSALPKIDFEKMLAYNAKYPDNPTMPYAVLTVREGEDAQERLPFVKGGKIRVDVDFVNPSLDRAYEKKEITGVEYLTGCPSFHAENAEFDVQGTSSQGYPRRNYKGKFKSKDDKPVVWKYTNGPLKDLSLQDKIEYEGKEYKYYYMDNKDASESTFTWKADYMESSGTHNTGFTSFVKTLYDYHPLKLYNEDYVTGDHRTTIYGFPMLVFQYKRSTNTYEFIGKYNFNLDKACNNVIDFKNGDVLPYIANNPNPRLEGYKVDKNGKPATYEMIAECWELKNNQGTRCSFKKVDFDETREKDNLLSVLDDIEYRYSYYEDDIDHAIDGHADFPDLESRNNYLRDKYRNIEALCAWLKSTDTESITGEDLPEPVIYGSKTYTKDDRDYRLAKFRNEFTQHFDPDYCYIYFIMTELILGYDSRGKNMMLGTWGPKSETGDYIWFPIFYDVDTQLGVNNSGVPTWEYDTDATEKAQFSTNDSVLWNNLWSEFKTEIKNRYIELRKKLLTIENLNGFYDFDPAISKSYAMKGVRPLVAYNIDEYYKYIDPAFRGYINTEGKLAITETFFYCLQGTRELQRELFLRNRFNYLDSNWLGGPYSKEAVLQGVGGRVNANRPDTTSDKFIVSEIDLDDPNVSEDLKNKFLDFQGKGGEILSYKQNPLDADVSIKLKPYLKQYVTLYFDETPGPMTKYDETEDFSETFFPEAVQKTIKETPMMSEQIIKIPAPEYVSSLGDISTLYLNELWVSEAIRLKDLYLGNEDPAYKNTSLTLDKVSLVGEALDSEGKPNKFAKKLLETLVFTNLGTFNSNLDITGSEKLKTCRALGTHMTGFKFAEGVQLETLYLPYTTAKLELIEPVELHGLLKEKPVKNSEGEFPKGLYIEDLTDVGEINPNSATYLNEINIIGGKKLFYDSYYIVDTAVKIKEQMLAKNDLDVKYKKTLDINLENIQWSPYRQVQYGELMVTNAVYCKLLDNYTFDHNYVPSHDTWEKDTLNGKVYEYTESLLTENSEALTDLSLLNKFIDSTKSVENYFTGTIITTGENTIPYISGDIFINNTEDTPISEFALKDTYKDKYFKNLNIYAKYVEPAYTAKFIQIVENNGVKQEVEWDIHKYDPAAGIKHPRVSTKEPPQKLHYDFKGWAISPNALPSEVLSEDDFNKLVFSENNRVYTFYAIFAIHEYWVMFKNELHDPTNLNPEDPAAYDHIEYIPSGLKLFVPTTYVPYKSDANLELTETYQFNGYSSESDGSRLVDLTELSATRNYVFYATFKKKSVYDNVVDESFLDFEPDLDNDGWKVKLRRERGLKGKITLPTTHNGKKITAIFRGKTTENAPEIDNGFCYNKDITHVFWADKGINSTVTDVEDYAFKNSAIKYFELPDSLISIGTNAFHLASLINNRFEGNIKYIGPSAFYNGLDLPANETLILGGSIETLGNAAFGWIGPWSSFTDRNVINQVIIGSPENKSKLKEVGTLVFIQVEWWGDAMDKMTIYPENPSDPIWSTIETNFQIPLNIIEIVG